MIIILRYLFQELLFCETCDAVFCSTCTGGSHKSGEVNSTADHTVIPFSIAIKRMSEILIYKANECTAKVISLNNISLAGMELIPSFKLLFICLEFYLLGKINLLLMKSTGLNFGEN